MDRRSSKEARDVARDQRRLSVEAIEGRDQRRVALIGGVEKPIVGGLFLGCLPHTLNRVELGRIGRKAEELDAVAIRAEPLLAIGIEVVARAVVEDEEHLSTRARN